MKKLKPGWCELGVFLLAFLLGWGLSVGWKAIQAYRSFQDKQEKRCQIIATLREIDQQQHIYLQYFGKGKWYTLSRDFLNLEWPKEVMCGNTYSDTKLRQKIDRYTLLKQNFDFQFRIEAGTPPTKRPAYRVIVRPKKNDQTGYALNDCYYLDQTGVIRHSGSAEITPDHTSQPINPSQQTRP